MSNFLSLLADCLTTGYKSVSSSPCDLSVSAPKPMVCLRETSNPDEQALLEKMLASISLYPGNNCIIKIDNGIPKQKMILEANNYKITTHHPEVLLQDASKKRTAWEDLKQFRAKIDAEKG